MQLLVLCMPPACTAWALSHLTVVCLLELIGNKVVVGGGGGGRAQTSQYYVYTIDLPCFCVVLHNWAPPQLSG